MLLMSVMFAVSAHLRGSGELSAIDAAASYWRRAAFEEQAKLDCLKYREQMEARVAQDSGANIALAFKLETTFSMSTYASCRALVRTYAPSETHDIQVDYEIRLVSEAPEVHVMDQKSPEATVEEQETSDRDEEQQIASIAAMPSCGSEDSIQALYDMIIGELSGSLSPYPHWSDEEVAQKIPKAFRFRGFTTLASDTNVRTCEVTADMDFSQTTDDSSIKNVLRLASPPKAITVHCRLTMSDDGRTLRATEIR